MSKEYIDKNEVLRMIKHEKDAHELCYSKEAYHRIYEMVSMMRPIKIEGYGKRAKWQLLYHKYGVNYYSCSNCNKTSVRKYDNCPNCGADMSKD